MLTLFPLGVVTSAGVTPLEPWVGLGPKAAVSWVWASPLGTKSLGVKSHLQPPSLRVALPTADTTFHTVLLQELGYVQGIEDKAETQEALGVSSGTFCSKWQSRTTAFSLALVA